MPEFDPDFFIQSGIMDELQKSSKRIADIVNTEALLKIDVFINKIKACETSKGLLLNSNIP